MQRTEPGQRKGYAGRKLATRGRNVAAPRTSSPGPHAVALPYRLRMRNTTPVPHSDWATLVKRMRAVTNMSGAELSRRLKVDRATIWRWETGKQKPDSLPLVQAFADLFGLALDDVLAAAGLRPAGAESPPQQPPLDPDLEMLLQKLSDPHVDDATKDYIRLTLRVLANLPAPTTPPRRPRKAG